MFKNGMTPIASQEPSRTGTRIRATTPAIRSLIHSGASTPMRPRNGGMESHSGEGHQGSWNPYCKVFEKKVEDHARKLSPLES
ncbi:Carboxy-terminal region remorin [Arachis hypogaea]|nr:Carboxy-terminal region remorin [Arachis hypogaea]